MVFHITFMLALFYDKKCCNFINLFSCILWDLIVMGLLLSGENLIKTVEGYMRSTCPEAKESVRIATHLTSWPSREMTRKMH